MCIGHLEKKLQNVKNKNNYRGNHEEIVEKLGSVEEVNECALGNHKERESGEAARHSQKSVAWYIYHMQGPQ
jgi:hypothetical protein